MVDLADRQSERTFRARQGVREFESMAADPTAMPSGAFGTGSSLRKAAEFLNQESDGFFCSSLIEGIWARVGGNRDRDCLFPGKSRESLTGLIGRHADLSSISLSGADLEQARNLSQEQLDFIYGSGPEGVPPR